MIVEIKNSNDMVRDMTNMAVINKNKGALEKAKLAKQLRLQKDKEFEQLKADVSEIKNLLSALVKTDKGQ